MQTRSEAAGEKFMRRVRCFVLTERGSPNEARWRVWVEAALVELDAAVFEDRLDATLGVHD